jgi:hypothetical protein
LPLWYSLTFICSVSCVSYVASFSGLHMLIAPLVFSDVFLSCVLCTLCCQFLWIVYLWLPLWYSLTFIRPVSCVPYVASFSGLYNCDCPFGILWRLFVLCHVYPMLPVSLDCPFVIAPLVFSDVYLSCVLCTLCCQFLWIVHFWLSLWYSLTFICPVSCVHYVVSLSGLYIFDCPFGILWHLCVLCLVYPMLSDSRIVHLWLPPLYSLTFICPVSCVPYFDSFCGLSNCDCPFGIVWHLCFLCLVYPMLPVSLDCPFVIAPLVFSDVYLSCVLCTLCCQFLWIVHFRLSLWCSLTFICPVFCVPYVVRFSGLYIFDCPFGIL